MSPEIFRNISHQEQEISLHSSNFSKEVSQLTDWQTYKQFGSPWILMFVSKDGACKISESYHQYWQIFPTFFWRKEGRKGERRKERKGVSKWRTQDVELHICPKGKGRAKNQSWRAGPRIIPFPLWLWIQKKWRRGVVGVCWPKRVKLHYLKQP